MSAPTITFSQKAGLAALKIRLDSALRLRELAFYGCGISPKEAGFQIAKRALNGGPGGALEALWNQNLRALKEVLRGQDGLEALSSEATSDERAEAGEHLSQAVLRRDAEEVGGWLLGPTAEGGTLEVFLTLTLGEAEFRQCRANHSLASRDLAHLTRYQEAVRVFAPQLSRLLLALSGIRSQRVYTQLVTKYKEGSALELTEEEQAYRSCTGAVGAMSAILRVAAQRDEGAQAALRLTESLQSEFALEYLERLQRPLLPRRRRLAEYLRSREFAETFNEFMSAWCSGSVFRHYWHDLAADSVGVELDADLVEEDLRHYPFDRCVFETLNHALRLIAPSPPLISLYL